MAGNKPVDDSARKGAVRDFQAPAGGTPTWRGSFCGAQSEAGLEVAAGRRCAATSTR
jgi:hypothetical protein